MTTYHQLRAELDARLCEKCVGRGKLDDSEPGDTYFNEWQCPDCKGTGLKPTQETQVDDVCPTTGLMHQMPPGHVCLYCHIGNLGAKP